MKAILEEYGQIILAMVIVLLMIGFAPSITTAVKDKWNGSIDQLIAKDNGGSTQQPQQPALDPNVTNYTLEQINADRNMYAIGKTKPEYVVAKVEADKITVTKNGENSDGIMKDFASKYGACEPLSLQPRRPEIGNSISVVLDIKKGVEQVGQHFYEGFWGDNSEGYYREEGELLILDRITSIKLNINSKKVNNRAFYNISQVNEVNLGENVESIGQDAFTGCGKINYIHIPSTVKNISPRFYGTSYNEDKSVPIFFCEAASKPAEWDIYWNYSDRPVYWNTKKEDIINFSIEPYGPCLEFKSYTKKGTTWKEFINKHGNTFTNPVLEIRDAGSGSVYGMYQNNIYYHVENIMSEDIIQQKQYYIFGHGTN